jgi:lactoylglutathione lyase
MRVVEVTTRRKERATMIHHVATVAVYVRDQDAAVEFYVDKLGFELRADRSMGPGPRWIEVAPPGAQTSIVLATKDFPVGSEEKIGGYTEIQLEAEDIEGTYEELTRRGAAFTVKPELQPWGRWHSQFVDPDGNEFYLVQAG